MKKQFLFIITFICIALTLFSCSEEESITPLEENSFENKIQSANGKALIPRFHINDCYVNYQEPGELKGIKCRGDNRSDCSKHTKCSGLEPTIRLSDFFTEAEIAQYWPGGDENGDGDGLFNTIDEIYEHRDFLDFLHSMDPDTYMTPEEIIENWEQ